MRLYRQICWRQSRLFLVMFALLIVVLVRQHMYAFIETADDIIPKPNFHKLDLTQLDREFLLQLIYNDRMSEEHNKLLDIHNTSDSRLAFFKPVITRQEKEILMDLIRRTIEICSMKNLSCMIMYSTLLGSYQHHDLIPWEDGAHVFVDKRHRTKLHQQLVNFTQSRYGLYTGEKGWKLYSKKYSIPSFSHEWKWPFLDISFFKMNLSHVWDEKDQYFTFPKFWILPTHLRPLWELQVPAPRNSIYVLRKLYGKGACQTQIWSHKNWAPPNNMHPISISCDNLKEYFCFVRRDPEVLGIRETLLQRDHVVHSYIVNEPPYTLSETYSLNLRNLNYHVNDDNA